MWPRHGLGHGYLVEGVSPCGNSGNGSLEKAPGCLATALARPQKVAECSQADAQVQNQCLPMMNASVMHIKGFFNEDYRKMMLDVLTGEVEWEQSVLRVGKHPRLENRMTCLMSDIPGITYAYSGCTKWARPWLPELEALRSQVAQIVSQAPAGYRMRPRPGWTQRWTPHPPIWRSDLPIGGRTRTYRQDVICTYHSYKLQCAMCAFT